MKKESLSPIEELEQIVEEVGPENVYRPIYDNDANLIIKGYVPIRDELIEDFSKLNFTGKTVVDLGCNFGFFSFLVRRRGASKVVGIDLSEKIIAGCKILKSLYRMQNVEFVVDNIESPNLTYGTFDSAMLIDYFGKNSIRKYKINKLLSNLEMFARKELLLVIRPIYKIREEIEVEPGALAKLYSAKYINKDYFHLIRYVEDYLANQWTMHPVSAVSDNYEKRIKLIQFVRRPRRKHQ